jgi:hypothetical protein
MTNAINAFIAGRQFRQQDNDRQQQNALAQEQRGFQNSFMKAQNALANGDRDEAVRFGAGSGPQGFSQIQQHIEGMDDRERQDAARSANRLGAVAATALQEVPDEGMDAWVRQTAQAYGLQLPELGRPYTRADVAGFVAQAQAISGELNSFLDRNEAVTLDTGDMRVQRRAGQEQVIAENVDEVGRMGARIDQQNANARTMAAQTAAQREQRQASQPQGAEWRTLTADEAAAQGFNGGDVVQVNSRTGQMARRSQDRPERMFNQQQSLAAEFANRMIAADQAIDRVSGEGFQGNEMTRGDIPVVGGVLRGSRERRYDQAVDDFITAVLRRESGAAISAAEFETAYRQYFPSLGDDPATIEQKRALRQRQIQNMQASSQGAFEAMFGDVREQPQGAQLGEGATATNPETGQRMIFRNGQWEPM